MSPEHRSLHECIDRCSSEELPHPLLSWLSVESSDCQKCRAFWSEDHESWLGHLHNSGLAIFQGLWNIPVLIPEY